MKKLTVLMIISILALFLVSCSSNQTPENTELTLTEDSARTSSEEVVIEESKQKEYRLGEEIVAGEFKWKITKFTKQEEIGEYFMDNFMGVKANGEFLIVEVEVENIGNSANYLMDSYLKLIDDKGREFTANTMAAIYIKPPGSALTFETINPGIVKKGKVVFDVPTNLKVVEVKISDSLMSNSFYTVKMMS